VESNFCSRADFSGINRPEESLITLRYLMSDSSLPQIRTYHYCVRTNGYTVNTNWPTESPITLSGTWREIVHLKQVHLQKVQTLYYHNQVVAESTSEEPAGLGKAHLPSFIMLASPIMYISIINILFICFRTNFNGTNWPAESPIARSYDVSNTSTKLIILNNKYGKVCFNMTLTCALHRSSVVPHSCLIWQKSWSPSSGLSMCEPRWHWLVDWPPL